MEDKLHNLRSHVNSVSLTAEEKASGREMLASFMSLTPVRTEQVAAPPRFAFMRFAHVGRAASVFAASFALLVSVGGVSYAAESSLPGDALYAVKVSFNEPVRAALTVSESDRADWEAERASRRLAEAEQLASVGKLDEPTRVTLNAEFLKHSEDAQAHVAKVKEEKGAGAAVDVSTRIEGTLRAHRQIMDAIASARRDQRKPKAEAKHVAGAVNAPEADEEPVTEPADAVETAVEDDDDAQVVALAASVRSEADSTASRRGTTEARESSESVEKAAEFAKGRHGAAENKIAEVRKWLTEKDSALTADSKVQAKARLAAADAALAEGDAAFADLKYHDAFDAYVKAQRLAQEAKLIAHVSTELKVQVRFGGSGAGRDTDAAKGGNVKEESGKDDAKEESRGSRFPSFGGFGRNGR